MDETAVDQSTAPVAPAVEAPKKTRKARTPKVKPPRKPRVSLGPIVLCVSSANSYGRIALQPPAEIANDAIKVSRWAAKQPALQAIGSARMVREYNVTMKISTNTVASSELVIDMKKEEVPQNP
jgi:hypothetical protein